MKKIILLLALGFLCQPLYPQRTEYPQIGAQVFIEPGQTDKQIDGFFRILAQHGFETARIRMFGAHMLRPDGSWDFTLYDKAFDAAGKHGVKLFATLFPPTDELGDVGGFKFPRSKAHLLEIAGYIEAVVSHFRGHPALDTWVLQNEPGTGGTGPGRNDLTDEVFARWKAAQKTPAYDNGYLKADFTQERFHTDFTTWYLGWIASQVDLHDPAHHKHINPHQLLDNLADYDFMYTNIWEEPFEINEATTQLPVHFTFKPLMARIKISLGLGANETPKKVILETDSNVLPTSGTIDAQENFTASSVTNSIAVPTNRKEFVVGLLPVGIYSTMTVKVMTTDGLTYSDKSFTLAGLKRNHHYTMSVPCNKKTVTITVPDAIDQKYGTHTYQDNGFYTVDSQYDPEGIFNDWYFYQAEIKSDKNGDDKLKKNRIQLQVPAGFNNANNGAFVTAPIQCEGSKTVKVSFEVATNRIRNIEYRIGVTGNGPITESWLRDRNNILNGNDQKCKSGTQTHTFTVTNGQRIMIKILSTAGSYHVEFADFTYTVE